MRIAALALLALFAGVSAVDIQTKIDIKTLKKSEFNSNTFFVDFDLYAFNPTPGCTGAELGASSFNVANAVGAGTAMTIFANDVAAGNAFVPSGYNCYSAYTFSGEVYSKVDFHNFPFDYQEHEIVIENLASTFNYLLVAGTQNFDKHFLHIDGWRDVSFGADSATITSFVSGETTQLFSYKKTVRREFTYFLSKYVSNVILLVIMAAFSAFLPVNDSIRVVISLLIFIAVIVWQFVIASKLPSAAYPNKYDGFIQISFAFLFAQFLYYTVHKALYKESNVEVKTLGEDAAEVSTGMTTAKKVDTVVIGIYSLIYFIAVASVLGIGSDLEF